MTRLKKPKNIYVAVMKMDLSFLQMNNPVNNQTSIGLECKRSPTGVLEVQELESILLIRSEAIIEAEQ